MANITGTNGKDTLKGTSENDIIQGLNGNDIINASNGSDTIDGGAGKDTVDYNSTLGGSRLTLGLFGSDQPFVSSEYGSGSSFAHVLVNIETIIGNQSTNIPNLISVERGASADIDLSKNRITYTAASFGAKTLTVKNFSNVSVTEDAFSSRIKGSDLDNQIFASRTTIIGSKGNDLFYGSNNNIDYSNIGQTLSLNINTIGSIRTLDVRSQIKIDKNNFGVDTIAGEIIKIIGTNHKENTINASAVTFGSKLDIDLKNNSLTIAISGSALLQPFDKIEKYKIVNFVNAVGGRYDDKIVGGDNNSKLTGGGGNDTITGGNKKDTITGSDSTARGVGEIDTLTGGGGKDKFVLGDKNGAYYVGKGNNDYALITDFNLFKDSISIGSLKNYSFALVENNTIDLYSGKDVKTRDLIAKIQIAGGISTVSSNSKSIAGSNPTLDAIVAKLDIVSGT